MRNKVYVKSLGIDFGSSKTSVVAICEGDMSPILFTPAQSRHDSYPTFMAKRKPEAGGDLLFFQDAVFEDPKHVEIYYRELKEDLETTKDQEAVKRYFEELKKALEDGSRSANYEFDFSRLSSMCYGYPAHYHLPTVLQYRRSMDNILKCVFGKNNTNLAVIPVPEPELAAHAYNYVNKNVIKSGETVLVLDFGGHTLDIAMMTAFSNGAGRIELMKSAAPKSDGGVHVPMGKEITRALCRQIYGDSATGICAFDPAVEEEKCKLFLDTKNSTMPRTSKNPISEGIERFQLSYFGPKEAVSGDILHVGIAGGGKHIDIEITYDQICESICTYLGPYGIDLPENSIHYVLFTGGTSMIKEMREWVLKEIKAWLVPSFDTETCSLMMEQRDGGAGVLHQSYSSYTVKLGFSNAVAFGAALIAAGECRSVQNTQKIQSDRSVEELQQKLKSEKDKAECLQEENEILRMQLTKAEAYIQKYHR